MIEQATFRSGHRLAKLALLGGAAIAATGLGYSLPASAQAVARADADTSEIVVTARRREEKVHDIPASLNVFGGAQLENTAVTRLDELQYRTPGLKVTGGGVATVAVRGVSNNVGGSGSGGSVAIHLDGVYAPRPAFVLMESYDLDRVEVLKGPQGTLYGRNATGGAINMVTRNPGSDFGIDGFVGYGTNNLVRAQAAINLPFENGGIRVSGAYSHDDGYTKNINPAGGRIDARDFKSVRVKGVYNFSDTVKGTVTVQFVDDDSNIGDAGSNNPNTPNFASLGRQRESARRINIDTPPIGEQKVFFVSAVLEADLGDVKLRSISGYLHNSTYLVQDSDGSSAPIEVATGTTRSNYVSQEFNLSGGSDTGFSWTAGVYGSQEQTRNASELVDNDFPVIDPYIYYSAQTRDRARTFAAFGEATFAFGHVTVVSGARYTKQTIRGRIDGSILGTVVGSDGQEKDDGFTPRALVQYRPNDATMLYASVTRGTKGGGLNYSRPVRSYRPEKIWAYEAGAKNRLWNGLANLDFSAFYYDYSNLQLRTAVFPPGEGVQIRVSNVAKAPIYGAEMAFDVHPVKGLSLEAAGGYLHTHLKDFISPSTLQNLSGPLPISPKWTLTAAAEYKFDIANAGAVTVRGEYNYTSGIIFPALSNPALERQGGVGLINASLRYDLPGDRIYVAVIGRNLSNKLYLTNRFFFDGFSDVETYAAPRTVEARLGFKF